MNINNVLKMHYNVSILRNNIAKFNLRLDQYLVLKILLYAYLSKKQSENSNINYSIISLKELRNNIVHGKTINLKKVIQHYDDCTSGILRGFFDDIVININKNIYNTKNLRQLILVIYNITSQFHHDDEYGILFHELLNSFAKYNRNLSYHCIPSEVLDLMIKLVQINVKNSNIKAYDPSMGTASLLSFLSMANDKKNIYISGQEMNEHLYNIAKMNLIINGINSVHIQIKNDNALKYIFPEDSRNNFNIVLSIPPFSQHWNGGISADPRFQDYGLAPKSKADYAFLLDGLYHLEPSGIMAIILPTGVLFRGSKEAKIRKNLILHHNIKAIIGLPGKIFNATNIPTVLLILKKHRKANNVLFINATKDYIERTNQRFISNDDINKIISTYINKKDPKGNKRNYHIASLDEIKANNYNLNIPRYIDMSHPKPLVNINNTKNNLNEINDKIRLSTQKLHKLEHKFNSNNK